MIVALPLAALLDSTKNCPDVIGECCTPFFMFVLLTSILFGWGAGILSVLASVLVSTWIDSMRHVHAMHMPSGIAEIGELILFAATCAAIIASVELVRRAVSKFARIPNPNEWSSGVIFSLEQGQAWASWPGQPLPVRLGPQHEVAAMMEDFLAQIDVARRLGTSAKVREA
jgi:hypothetical protein